VLPRAVSCPPRGDAVYAFRLADANARTGIGLRRLPAE
jgi:hypothetical protein